MHYLKTLLLVLICGAALSGCAGTSQVDRFVFDGSSAQAMQRSVDKLANQLPRRQLTKYMAALLSVQFSDVCSAYEMLGDPAMMQFNYDILAKKLDGKSYQQLLQIADQSANTTVTGNISIGGHGSNSRCDEMKAERAAAQ